MEEIIYNPEVIAKIDELVKILFKKEYFSFIENAEIYVNDIYDFIDTIPTLKNKRSKNKKYGEYYCTYKSNKNTSWYVSFDTDGSKYLIQNITNNHSSDYPRFISGLQ